MMNIFDLPMLIWLVTYMYVCRKIYAGNLLYLQ